MQWTLTENDQGYIIWCQHCHHFSVNYQTACLALSTSEFKALKVALGEMITDGAETVPGRPQSMLLRSTKWPMALCLTKTQTEHLREMIFQAEHMYRVYELKCR